MADASGVSEALRAELLGNEAFVLASLPSGVPEESNWRKDKRPIQPDRLNQGQVILKSLFISADPYLRLFLPSQPGGVQNSYNIGQVVFSKNDKYPVGSYLTGELPWARFNVTDGSGLTPFNFPEIPLSAAVGIMGMPGKTSYFGVTEACKLRQGETIVISGAAGAVGSVCGQIAKILGARVVGIAGSAEKCKYLTEQLGFDAVLNYKEYNDAAKLTAALKEVCPKGVDSYFDNVGGWITDSILELLNQFARVVICGQISQYNNGHEHKADIGPRPYMTALMKCATITGHQWATYIGREQEFYSQMAKWIGEGKLKLTETILQGFDQLPAGLVGLFKGSNLGKLVIQVSN